MSTLFISHSSLDNDIARELERRLAEQNHPSVFLDLDPEKGIVAGQSWERTLYRKLRACRAVVVLCTDNYLRSQWCFAEIALARMEGKHILALQVDPLSPDAKLPSILTEKQFIDLRTNTEEGYQRLWRGLEELELLGSANEWNPREPPYLGLSAYQERHAAVFFGRDDETRSGLELLDRGSPGLIMVLGASGSGKSSMVRAGMVPRLRRDPDRWLVVGPVRPRRDPFAELADAFATAFETYAPDNARSVETRQHISVLRNAGAGSGAGTAAVSATGADPTTGAVEDQRLHLLLKQLEELRRSPPKTGGSPLQDFLDWSLDDLKRICGETPSTESTSPARRELASFVDIADHLRRTSGHTDARVLLVIDQFEELLGTDDPGNVANRFLEQLRPALEAEHSPLMALGTMRSDFLGLFQRNRALLGIDFESLSVGPMTINGMRRVIEEPAKLGAIELEPGLADSLLADTETPDALPLLSFTLLVLWRDYRGDGLLAVREYNELGGLHGSVAREAEAVLSQARKQGKVDDVRRAFLQMARVTEDGSYARQPVSWDREEIQSVQTILEDFENRRLLVTRMEVGAERTVEVAHEALFRSWGPLRNWLDDHRGALLLTSQIRRDTRAWEESGCARDNLWRGGRLQQAAELMRKGELSGSKQEPSSEEKFVRAGVRRRRIQRGTLAGITICVFAVLAGFLGMAKVAESEAQKQSIIAQAIGAKNLLSTKPAEGVVKAMRNGEAAIRMFSSGSPPQQVRSSWLEALQLVRDGAVERNGWLAHGGEIVTSVAISPDGQTIATGGWDKNVWLWDREGQPIREPFKHVGGVKSVAWTDNGQTIVSAGFDAVRFWDRHGGGPSKFPVEGMFSSVAVSADGQVIAGAGGYGLLWDRKGASLTDNSFDGSGTPLLRPAVSISDDGRTVVCSTDDNVWLRDEAGEDLWKNETDEEQQVDQARRMGARAAAISPDGQIVVVVYDDWAVRIWDRQGRLIGKPLRGHLDAVACVALSYDGKTIVSGGEDGMVRRWDLQGDDANTTVVEQPPLKGHDGTVSSVAVTADGKTIVSAGRDGMVRLWERPSDTNENVVSVLTPGVASIVMSSDSKTIITADSNGTVLLWDRRGSASEKSFDGQVISIGVPEPDSPEKHTEQPTKVTAAALSSNGKFLAIGRSVQISQEEMMEYRHLRFMEDVSDEDETDREPTLTCVAVSDDGKVIVSGDDRGTVQIWNQAGKPIGNATNEHTQGVTSVAVSSDGHTIVSGGDDGKVLRWNTDGSKVSPPLVEASAGKTYVAVSPDGQTIVSGNSVNDVGMLRLISRHGVRAFVGHENSISSVSFSPDGTTIITAGGETLQLWDLKGKRIGQPFKTTGSVSSAVVSPDGQTLVLSEPGSLVVNQIGLDSFLQEASDWLRHHPLALTDEAVADVCLEYGGWSESEKARFLVGQGRLRAEAEVVEPGLAKFMRALELAPDIDLDPNTKAIDRDPEVVAEQFAAAASVKRGH